MLVDGFWQFAESVYPSSSAFPKRADLERLLDFILGAVPQLFEDPRPLVEVQAVSPASDHEPVVHGRDLVEVDDVVACRAMVR